MLSVYGKFNNIVKHTKHNAIKKRNFIKIDFDTQQVVNC